MGNTNKIFSYIVQDLSENLKEGISFVDDIITYPYKRHSLERKFKFKSSYDRSFRNLVDRNLIIEKDDKFYLTLKGKIELIRQSNGKCKIKTTNWDGIWRIVCFDIPEVKRKNRDSLRVYLYCLGFKLLQKSIWITPNKVTYDNLKEVFDNALSEKITFLECTKISNEEKLKKRFELI